MTRDVRLGLRSKSLLFLAGYTLILEGGILGYFYYSGRTALERRSLQELETATAQARGAVEGALSDSVTELMALRSQLLLYPAPAGPRDAPLKVLEELVMAAPHKYAEIGFFDRKARRMFVIRAVSELGANYPVVEARAVEDPGGDCPPQGPETEPAHPCLVGPLPGPREEILKILLPLTPGAAGILVAGLHMESVLDALGKLALPPRVSAFAASRRGLILYAADLSLLRTLAANSAPHLGFGGPGGDRFQRTSGKAILIRLLKRPEIVLAVQKDESAELRELKLGLLRVAAFTALFTLLALAGVQALTGRMAQSLHHVTEVADSVAGGDFSRRIAIRRNDELGRLIDSFNSMTAELEGSYRTLRDVNRQLHDKIEELTRTRRRLSRKQRLALLGEAISTISHEIQNRIGGVAVWVQNLERYGAKDENTRLCVREMKASLASFFDMLVHFKRFYRQPQLVKRSISIRELVEPCVARLKADLEAKQLLVRTDLGEEDVEVEADASQMSDAIVNLLLNAAFFSPESSTIDIGLRRDGDYAILSIRDRGPGIAAKSKLFQPFYTTKPSGSGLGLSVVRNIVHAHAGRIRGYNCSDGGACFEMRLPAGDAGGPAPDGVAKCRPEGTGP